MDEITRKCMNAYEKRDYQTLKGLCEEILESDENSETALSFKLYVHREYRQYHLLFKASDKIRKLYPENVHPYRTEAMAYLDLGEYENALKSCNDGMKIRNSDSFKKMKTEALAGLGMFEEAYEFYASSQIPGYTFTNALINSSKYSQIPQYCSIDDAELAVLLLERCRYLYNRGWRAEEIIEVCSIIFKLDSGNEMAFEYIIPELGRLERTEEALAYADRAIEIHPKSYRFLFDKAEILLWTLGDIDGAIEYLRRGLSMVDDFERHWPEVDNMVEALFQKSEILIKSESYTSAVEVLDEILIYRPREFRALEAIVEITEKHNTGYVETPHYRKSVKLKKLSDEREKMLDECLNEIEIGDVGDEYVSGCSEFKDYASFGEYVRDIIICLIATYPYESEEDARFLVKSKMSGIKKSYEFSEPAFSASMEVGYCGG